MHEHMTIFQDGQYSITFPSSCTLAGKLIKCIYIIVPMTALLSSTTKKVRKRKRECRLSRVLMTEHVIVEPITESAIKSTIKYSETPGIASTYSTGPSVLSAPSIDKTKSIWNCLTISGYRIWHQPVAHKNSTIFNSLIDGYTNDDSMCTVCIQAMHKTRFIRVPVKHTTKPFELVQSHVCSAPSRPTIRDNWYCILFIDDPGRFTSVWLLPNEKTETCTSINQSFEAEVDWMGNMTNCFGWDDWQGEYSIKPFRYVLMAHCTSCEHRPPYGHHQNGVAENMILTIIQTAHVMMIDCQAPVWFWGEAFNTAVYPHQRLLNECLERINDHDRYQARISTSNEILRGVGKPMHNTAAFEILYQTSLHNLPRFRC